MSIMKISINYVVLNKIWGGGNKFVSALIKELKKNKHEVIHHLNDNDIDLILIIDPRKYLANINYGAGAVLKYILFKNPNSVVVHRINECDERKNTKLMNFFLRTTNFCADHTVFVGSWLKNLRVWDKRSTNHSVILNGSDKTFFNSKKGSKWNNLKPIKIITHHWSNNYNKGFDIYKYLDKLLFEKNWRNIFEFTYVGNIPNNFTFHNAKHIQPKYDKELSNILKKHHIYLTASINEPGGNHQNEGGMCGLPILYRESGCMKEYCHGYGVSFKDQYDIEKSLKLIIKNYFKLKSKMQYFDRDIQTTVKNYIELFTKLNSERNLIVKKRAILKYPFKVLINLIFN